jgi:predicted  nucleic acid-binding Zn-ribbon protein
MPFLHDGAEPGRSPGADAAHDADGLGVCLAVDPWVTTNAAPTPLSTPTSDARPADLILLVELAEVCGNLRRLRRDSASANADLRQRRSRVIHLDALLRADSIALATLRESDTADRVAVEILDDAVDGARTARASAKDSAARAADSLGPMLERLSRAITHLERQANALRARLSPPTARLLDLLARRNISPPVAALEHSACGECHVRLPTALANAMVRGSTAHRCPHCKRILVPAPASQLASAV